LPLKLLLLRFCDELVLLSFRFLGFRLSLLPAQGVQLPFFLDHFQTFAVGLPLFFLFFFAAGLVREGILLLAGALALLSFLGHELRFLLLGFVEHSVYVIV